MTRTTLALLLIATAGIAGESASVPPAPNGMTIPLGYKDWRLISVSQRTENETLRAILGNDIAIQAARSGHTNPWPDGTVLAKLVWKQKQHPAFATANVPDQLVHAEFMEKNSARFADTGGWGFGRWLGLQQQPYGHDAAFAKECFGCHEKAKSSNWVFTAPAPLP